MNVLVVEESNERRAELVDALCEIRDVDVRAAAAGVTDSWLALTAHPIDAVVLGTLPPGVRTTVLARVRFVANVIDAEHETVETLSARLSDLARRRHGAAASFSARTARARLATLQRDTEQAGPHALSYRLGAVHRGRTRSAAQTIALRDWLPAAIQRIQSLIPRHVELVSVIAADTPPVRCMPNVIEHEMLEAVLDAVDKLPWGGTIWFTVSRAGHDRVCVDVIENGRGTRADLTLRACAATSS